MVSNAMDRDDGFDINGRRLYKKRRPVSRNLLILLACTLYIT
jgi:hypothetical protein